MANTIVYSMIVITIIIIQSDADLEQSSFRR